jgi:hypothetical protein
VSGRLVIVAVVVVIVAVVARAYRDHRARAASSAARTSAGPQRVPARLLGGADRTWIVFTSPYCVSCGPLAEHLRRSDPTAEVVVVDASRDPAAARELKVLSAPTTFLVDADGRVAGRFVGSPSVHRFLDETPGLNPAA